MRQPTHLQMARCAVTDLRPQLAQYAEVVADLESVGGDQRLVKFAESAVSFDSLSGLISF
jgi:hypothetical protein